VYLKNVLKEKLNPTVNQKLFSGNVYNHIGLVYQEKCDYDNALDQHRKALEIQLKVLGPDDTYFTATSYNNIGVVYHAKGDYENALVEYCECLDIQLTVLGPNHFDTIRSLTMIKRALSMI
jgi:tetratricopeptide (TPR) repeat protein